MSDLVCSTSPRPTDISVRADQQCLRLHGRMKTVLGIHQLTSMENQKRWTLYGKLLNHISSRAKKNF